MPDQPGSIPPRVMRVTRAAEVYGISAQTLKKLGVAGEVDVFPLNDSPNSPKMVTVASIEAYIARRLAKSRGTDEAELLPRQSLNQLLRDLEVK